MVLVLRLIDHRNLPLPKGIVERIVDLADSEPEACRRRTVDDQISLQCSSLLIEIDIRQYWKRFQRGLDLGGPFVEFFTVFTMQCVLVLSCARTAADPNVLNRPEI